MINRAGVIGKVVLVRIKSLFFLDAILFFSSILSNPMISQRNHQLPSS